MQVLKNLSSRRSDRLMMSFDARNSGVVSSILDEIVAHISFGSTSSAWKDRVQLDEAVAPIKEG